jgi:hypothetical protein
LALPGIRSAGMQDVLATDGYVSVETPNSVFCTNKDDDDPQHLTWQTQAIIKAM